MNVKKPAMHETHRVEFIALIAILMSLNALATDVMLPALPYMGKAFGIAVENDWQLVLSVYLIGFGLAQIVFGPLSDRFGRKKPLMVGMVIYVAAVVAASFAPNFETLLVLRFIQGTGAAATRVIAVSIVRDCFAGRAMAEVMSLVIMAFMIVPIIAPSIGQVLLLTGPWWTIFLFMGALGAVVSLWALLRLPETLDESNRRPLTFTSITSGFGIVFSNRVALSYGVAGTFMFGAMLSFIYTAQQVFVGIYDFGSMFPIVFAGLGLTMAVSSYINSHVVRRFGMRRISHFAIIGFTVNSLLWFLTSLTGPIPFALFFMFIVICMFMFGWIISNINSLSMEPLGNVAGTASAVFGFVQTVGGAILGAIIGQQFDGTQVPLTAGFFVMGLCAVGCIMFAEKGRLFGEGV